MNKEIQELYKYLVNNNLIRKPDLFNNELSVYDIQVLKRFEKLIFDLPDNSIIIEEDTDF